MWPNSQFPADLIIFTEEIHNGKLHFFCSAIIYSWYTVEREQSQAGFDYGRFAKVKAEALCVAVYPFLLKFILQKLISRVTRFLLYGVELFSFISFYEPFSLREKCPNTEFFMVRIFLYSDQKKLRIWKVKAEALCVVVYPFLLKFILQKLISRVTRFILYGVELFSFISFYEPFSLREKCPNTEFFMVRIFLYSDQKKLRIWTLFTQWFFDPTSDKEDIR